MTIRCCTYQWFQPMNKIKNWSILTRLTMATLPAALLKTHSTRHLSTRLIKRWWVKALRCKIWCKGLKNWRDKQLTLPQNHDRDLIFKKRQTWWVSCPKTKTCWLKYWRNRTETYFKSVVNWRLRLKSSASCPTNESRSTSSYKDR